MRAQQTVDRINIAAVFSGSRPHALVGSIPIKCWHIKCRVDGLSLRTSIQMQAMKTKKQGDDIRKIRADVLRQAAEIAESAQSPLAVELWNEACQRIQQLLRAEITKIEHS